MKIFSHLTNAFPLWIAGASLLALFRPELFTWFSGPWITAGLGIIMLGMGLTLTLEDFREVAKRPGAVFAGFALQYTLMPLIGWTLAALFRLPPPLAAGLILVACCPGGTASNVVTFLARADLPLSVTLTACSTLMAVIMTPALTLIFAGSRVDVSFWGLMSSTFQVVILPIAAGTAMNRFLPGLTRKILPAAPLAAVIFITLIVASIVGAGNDEIIEAGFQLLGAVFSLHALGFLFGYIAGRLLLKDEVTARTISIEVGMQNSGLGVVLARANFADPLTAIPSALSSVWHSLIGSFLAAVWRARSEKKKAGEVTTPPAASCAPPP